MARTRGQIRKRGKEKYLVRVYLGRVNGKRKYRSKTVYGDEKHAEKELTKMLRGKDRGTLRRWSDETLAEIADEWLKTKKGKVKASTYGSYERYIRRHIKPGLGYVKLEELGSRLIQGFVNELDQEKGLSGLYVRQIHTCLRGILKLALRWEIISRNPADGDLIDLPATKSRDYRTLTKAEIQDFLKAAEGERLYALFVLLVTTGLRPQEAFGLKWKDLEDGWLNVRRVISIAPKEADDPYEVSDQMKTNSSKRRLKLGDFTQEVLERHRRRQAEEILKAGEMHEREDFIFTRGPDSPRHGRFIYQEYARRYFKAALRKAGLPADEIRVCDLRHTHISALIMEGVDLKWASERAGHSSIQQTADTYAHLTEGAEVQMAEVADGWMEQAG